MARAELEPKSGIYQITCTCTGKIYVGSSSNIRDRVAEHKRQLRLDLHENPYLQNAWNKYGELAFSAAVLEHCSADQLLTREQYWIDAKQPFNEVGFNINSVAAKPPVKRFQSASAREKLRIHHTGLIHDAPTREKMKQSALNRNKKTYLVISPDDQEFTIQGLKQFCEQQNLHYPHMVEVAKGNRQQSKGWKCRYITNG